MPCTFISRWGQPSLPSLVDSHRNLSVFARAVRFQREGIFVYFVFSGRKNALKRDSTSYQEPPTRRSCTVNLLAAIYITITAFKKKFKYNTNNRIVGYVEEKSTSYAFPLRIVEPTAGPLFSKKKKRKKKHYEKYVCMYVDGGGLRGCPCMEEMNFPGFPVALSGRLQIFVWLFAAFSQYLPKCRPYPPGYP